jgi:hypothetical protein
MKNIDKIVPTLNATQIPMSNESVPLPNGIPAIGLLRV